MFAYKVCLLTISTEEEMLSEGEDLQDLHKLSINKVQGWITGHKITENTVEHSIIHLADDPNDWEVKSTPKTLRNRELLPKSSLLALQPSELSDRGRAQPKESKKSITQTVTRTMDPETNNMTVSSLSQKRRGRRNQRS